MLTFGRLRLEWTTVIPLAALVALIAAWQRYPSNVWQVVLGLLMAATVLSAVHHAEIVAHRVGEPFGSLVLAVAVTIIEVALILTMTLSGTSETPTLARDTVFAAVMITVNGIMGLSLFVSARRFTFSTFNAEGTGGALATVIALAVTCLVIPAFTHGASGPQFTAAQLAFAGVASLALYAMFVVNQTLQHRDFFLPVVHHYPPGGAAVASPPSKPCPPAKTSITHATIDPTAKVLAQAAKKAPPPPQPDSLLGPHALAQSTQEEQPKARPQHIPHSLDEQWAEHLYMDHVDDEDTPEDHAQPPSNRTAWASFILLVVSLVGVVGLAKVESAPLEKAILAMGLPLTFVGVVIALLILLPETLSAANNAKRNRMQTSMNLAFGSAMASVGLTIPTLAVATIWIDAPLHLGLEATQIVLLALTSAVAVLTVVPGRATRLQGGVHLIILAAFLFLAAYP